MNQPPHSVPVPQGGPSGRERKDKWAGWALGLGIASFIPFVGPPLGLVGLTLGVLALAGRTRRRASAVAGICLSTAGVWLYVFFGFVAPRFWTTRHASSICAANLNTIGKGYHLYMADYYIPPADEQTLMATGTIAQLFKCPSAKAGRPSDYFFLPASGRDAEATAIVACDFIGNHKDGRNILYHSGSVRWTDEEAFQAELAQPHNAAFAAALKKAEGPPPGRRPLWPR